MSQRVDCVRTSLPSPEQLILDAVEETPDGTVLRARASRLPHCPACMKAQVSYHSRYLRRMRDLPWQGRQVEIHPRTRRFRCRNNKCELKIFAERLSGVVTPNARETARLCEIVGMVGYALAGLPGERILSRLGIKSGDDTVLRRIKSRLRETSQVRMLSVDDWAWRKHQRYETMLMDLERLEVTDLLPVRSADSFAHWLSQHPEVEVITRDRSSLYADGGRRGAPLAIQITDRYRRFGAMLRWRNAKRLNNWIKSAKASGFHCVAQFAGTLRRDLEAVGLSITTPWSNGEIEGHINRLKTIKRQMYGRAGFELLKARVLPWNI